MSFTIDPVSLILGLATLIALIVLGFLISAQNARMAWSLDELNRVASDWLLIQLKDRREARLSSLTIDNPMGWVERQCGKSVTQVQRVVEQACAVDLLSPEGARVVVSPYGRDELLRITRPMRQGVGGQLIEPLLGRNPRKAEVIVRDLSNAGEWFDAEAGLVGQMLQVSWGEPTRLYFYIVPLK